MSHKTSLSYAMSGSQNLNLLCKKSSNPNNTPIPISSHVADACAQIIQRLVKNRDIERSATRMKKKRRDQSYRVFLIKYLSGFISAKNCKCLLLGSDDPEVLSTYSPFDQYHVTLKARHVVDALEAMHSATTNEIPITWIKACEIACKRNRNMVKRPQTIADWYLDLHSTRDKL